MELPVQYLSRFRVRKRKLSRETALAWEIVAWLKVPVSLPLKFLKMKRFEDILTLIKYMRTEGISDKRYFMGACYKIPNKNGYKKDGKQIKLLK